MERKVYSAPTERDKLYINGAWAAPSCSRRIDVHNASTGKVMGGVPAGEARDIDAAVSAARAAFWSWSATPVTARAACLAKIATGLQARAQEIAALVAQEVGMPVKLGSLFQAVC